MLVFLWEGRIMLLPIARDGVPERALFLAPLMATRALDLQEGSKTAQRGE